MASKRRTDAEPRRVNVHLDALAHQRLGVHALMTRESPGAILSRLVNEHLREWHVRANPRHSSDRPESADLVNIPALDGPALA